MSSVAEAPQAPEETGTAGSTGRWSEYRSHAWVVALGALVLTVIWSGVRVHVARHEHSAFDQAQREIANFAIASKERIERAFLTLDQAMRFAQAAYGSDASGLGLKALVENAPALRHVAFQVTDEQGRVVAASSAAAAPVRSSIARQDEFTVHRHSTDVGLFIGRARPGPDGRRSVQLSHRLGTPDGTFKGVLVASVQVDELAALLAVPSPGEGGSVSLIGRDGFVRARAPSLETAFDTKLSLRQHGLAKCRDPVTGEGTCRIVSPIDGIERIYEVRPLHALPLLVVAGRTVAAIAAHVAQERRVGMTVGLLLSAATLGLCLLLLRQAEVRRSREAELRVSQVRLRQTTAHFATTLDNIDQGLLMIDPCGRVQVCNRRAVELLDLPQNLVDGKPFFEAICDLQLARGDLGESTADVAAWDPFNLKPNTSLVYERTLRDGRILEVRTVRLPDNGAVRTYTDITQRKQAECAAQRARIEAERDSDAKTEFLATMSHEIRTPLNSILGFTGLILDRSDLDQDVKRQVQLIQGSGAALLTVVNDILDFSKIEAGQVDLDPRSFETRVLIGSTLSIVKGLAGAKRLEIRADIDPGLPPWLVGDEDRIRQILLNLLNNAVKFTREGHVALAVRVEASLPDGELVRFSVADTGIGIPKARQSLLFQRFSQVDGSIRREFGGTGLGLAISQRLVELMGGEIGVQSEHREGSTFWFTVRLPRGEAPTAQLAKPASSAATGGRKARILLAEDVEVNQEIACAVLESVGHCVDVVSDGSEAVMAVQESDYDLVLMDIQMPVVDGVTATRRIRELDGPAGTIPIIAMTANVLPEQVARFMAAGMSGHVGKPFKREELSAVIDQVLVERSGPVPAADPPSAPWVDAAAYGSLVEIMGASGVRRLLETLEARLRDLPVFQSPTPDERQRLAKDAHALVSAAGMLGFLPLSQSFRELEAACVEGTDLDVVLSRLRNVLAATLNEISSLKEAA
jgi:signal transduction histidine kinase